MDVVDLAIGQDFSRELRILALDGAGRRVSVTLAADAAAGATSLTVKPDHPALASGDKLLLGANVIVTLSATCDVGTTSMAVTATPAALNTGQQLAKVQDLTGFTVQAEALASRGDATPVIASADITVTLATQTGNDRGKLTLAVAAAVTAALDAAALYLAVWRRDSGSKRLLYEASLRIQDAGFE
jgi:hypothetical protein